MHISWKNILFTTCEWCLLLEMVDYARREYENKLNDFVLRIAVCFEGKKHFPIS